MGRQRVEANPYRTVTAPYNLYGVLFSRRVGRALLFVNGENLANVNQTDWDPLLRPSRGVDGRWTVEMLLIFRLGRPDVLPADDYGIRKGFAVAFRKRQMPTPKEVLARGERWRPYRTVASWYLWRLVEQAPLQAGASK